MNASLERLARWKYFRPFLAGLVFLLVLVACALLANTETLRYIVREMVVTPAYFLVWLFGWFIRSVDQVVLWWLGLVVLILILTYGLSAANPGRDPQPVAPWRIDERPPPASGRVGFWRNRIESLRASSKPRNTEYASFDFRRLEQRVQQFRSGAQAPKEPLAGRLSVPIEDPAEADQALKAFASGLERQLNLDPPAVSNPSELKGEPHDRS
jgi:hypothetical protein